MAIRTYDQILHHGQDPGAFAVYGLGDEKLTEVVEEYEAKAPRFDGELRRDLERLASLGRDEISRRKGLA